MRPPPFVVLALPRSRTAWLSSFLSYDGRHCDHEPSARFRDVEDMEAYFQDGVGCADTMLALRWSDIVRICPNVRIAVVVRPINDVRESVRRQGYQSDQIDEVLTSLSRSLREAARWRGSMSIRFTDLDKSWRIKNLWQHCLGVPFDREWFQAWRDVNVQADPQEMARIVDANSRGIMALYGKNLET